MEKISKKEAKNKHKPWLTHGILNSIKIKTRWLKKFLKSKNTAHYKTYKLDRLVKEITINNISLNTSRIQKRLERYK